MKTEQRHIDGTRNNRNSIKEGLKTSTSYIMPFIVAGVIWLFTTVIDTTDSLHTLEAKVDTFNTLSAEKVQIQIKNMEGDLTELKTSFKELNKKLGKDQEEIMKLLIKINGNK